MTPPPPLRLAPWSEPPLVPSGDQGRSLLRRELAQAEYAEDNLVQRILNALARLVDDGLRAASEAPPLSTLAAMLVAVLLAVALGWLAARTRRTARAPGGPGVVVEDHTVTADEWATRARRALADGRSADAVVDGFRALAVRGVEHGIIDDLPGATAHEVAVALGGARPDRASETARAAGWFDAVLYGDRPADEEQARAVLDLDAVRTR